MTVAPGWYADPASAHHLRWWNGLQWTDQTQLRPPSVFPASAGLALGSMTAPAPAHGNDVLLPPQVVEFGYLPHVCARHGLPARQMKQAPVYSRTPMWVIPLALISLLVGLLIALALRQTVWGPWPVCDRCLARRSTFRNAMWACLAAAVLSIVGAIALSSIWLLVPAVALLVAAVTFHGLGDWYRVTSASVDSRRAWVRIKSPAPAFAAAVQRGL